jgi:hypothetical protein
LGSGTATEKILLLLLLVDNCLANPVLENLENIKLVLENLENIKLVLLPANNTSLLQPMNQGVIRSLKCHFRKLILLRMIECIEKKQDHMVTLLDAIRCVEKRGDVSRRELSATVSVTREFHQEYKKVSTSLRRKTTSMMMMICLCPSGCGKLIAAFCDSMTMMRMQPQTITLLRPRHKEEIVREMRSKDGKEVEEQEEVKEEEEEEKF